MSVKLMKRLRYTVGLIMLQEHAMRVNGYKVTLVQNEGQMFDALVAKVREFDPDILLGFDIHRGSWGYLVERSVALKRKWVMSVILIW